MHKLVSNFIEQRAISKEMELNEPLYNAIFYLEKTNEFINNSCLNNEKKLVSNVSWPSMHDMYKRNYEYCCGVIGCFLIGQFPSSEALCRTAIEGSVNLQYVSLGDSMEKQMAYFKNYLETERKQNKSWKESVKKSKYSKDVKEVHYQRIIDKEGALDHYENALRTSLSLSGVNYDEVDLKWPNIFIRFKEINNEVGYRTVYTALCSQAHNDAEDILNKIMSRVIDNVTGMEEAQLLEQYNFSLYLLLMAVDYYILSSALYITKFNIEAKKLMEYKDKILKSIIIVTENGPRLISEKLSYEKTSNK